MEDSRRKSANDGERSAEKGRTSGGKTVEEDCRCKEVSKKTFPELLRVMIRDFAFWKKGK